MIAFSSERLLQYIYFCSYKILLTTHSIIAFKGNLEVKDKTTFLCIISFEAINEKINKVKHIWETQDKNISKLIFQMNVKHLLKVLILNLVVDDIK